MDRHGFNLMTLSNGDLNFEKNIEHIENALNAFPIDEKPDMSTWDRKHLKLADTVALYSKDPSTQVGAVVVDSLNRIVSVGYNGFPRKIEDTSLRLSIREEKYKYTIHGEMNAILFAERNLSDCSIYSTFMPCMECAKVIIQSGISRVVSYQTPKDKIERWKESFEFSSALFTEAGVDLVLYEREL